MKRKLEPVIEPATEETDSMNVEGKVFGLAVTPSENQSSSDPEVSEKPARRKFTAKYKLRILREADGCTKPGQIGALLRQEGLYSSSLSSWRQQRDKGVLGGLTPKKRGRKAKEKNPLSGRVAELERENQKLQNRLSQAEIIMEVQKKVATLLGVTLKSPGEEDKS